MAVEQAMENLEEKMKQTDEKLDVLAVQVGNIENEIFAENGEQIEVNNLLRSVNEVKTNYQNLRKELMEVQDLQKQLSSTLQFQLRMMQSKFNTLKEKIIVTPLPSLPTSSMTSVTEPKSPRQQQHQHRRLEDN